MTTYRQKREVSAVLISVVLHIILFGLLLIGSFFTHTIETMGGGEGDGDIIGAVMVDTGSAAQEWGRLQQQKKGQTDKAKPETVVEEHSEPQQTVEQQNQEIERQKQLEKQKEQARQQAAEQARQEALEKAKEEAEAKAKKAAEAAKLKADAEAKRLAAAAKQAEEEAKAKAAKEAKEKAEKEAKAKAEKEAKAKADKEAKAKADKEAKDKAAKEAKAKADKEAKDKAAKEAKAKADQEAKANSKANQAALDDLFGSVGGGSASKGGNANKAGSQGSGAALGAGDGGKTGDQYGALIKKEIKRRLLVDPSLKGKVCDVRINLDRDGTITGYQRVSGPDDICSAALSAIARTKKVPAAPSDDIYRKYKSPTISVDLK